MAEYRSVLVVCADRDNDLGRKANVTGPILGKKECLNAAAKLAIKDPEDSDVNSIFAAVKKHDEVKKAFPHVEVCVLTGHSKAGFKADKIINEQLDNILKKFPADAIILVTDGIIARWIISYIWCIFWENSV